MSDESTSQRVMEVTLQPQVKLEPCTGGPGCECCSKPSGPPSSPASPSRSASSTIPPLTSGDTSAFTEDSHSGSDASSFGAPPIGLPVQDWGGLGTLSVGKCEHGCYTVMKQCWGGKNTGRRFLGCGLETSQQCGYVEWLDDPWPVRVQAAFKKLWREVKATRDVQVAAHDALIEAYKNVEKQVKEKDKLKEETERTKRLAEQLCSRYERRVAFATADKSWSMFLVYNLIGLIIFLVAVLVVKL
ncbi:hypothetical protein SORBI_3010G272600 [Sorghum bicolor]|uniref:Zinc finger GRF-type domain-containing protein n=1 Tax=Sorghum bicolor TaxID=4558 RepID=A0A194YLV6_SORBI|nr:hypothetical protein SORBI_3010G272600 [Sorghum bicolor]